MVLVTMSFIRMIVSMSTVRVIMGVCITRMIMGVSIMGGNITSVIVCMPCCMAVSMRSVTDKAPDQEDDAGEDKYSAYDVALLCVNLFWNCRPISAMMPPRMSEVSTCPSEARKVTRTTRVMLQRCVRAMTASGTQWSGRMECRIATVAAAPISRKMDVEYI